MLIKEGKRVSCSSDGWMTLSCVLTSDFIKWPYVSAGRHLQFSSYFLFAEYGIHIVRILFLKNIVVELLIIF